MPHQDNNSIVIGRDVFKALASENRIQILSLLHKKPMTVTRISKELRISKATAYEHLKKLTESKLVKRKESQNIWVYYDLTRKGRALFSQSSLTGIRIALIAAISIEVIAIAAFLHLLNHRFAPWNRAMGTPPLELQLAIIILGVMIGLLLLLELRARHRGTMNPFRADNGQVPRSHPLREAS
jgi:DNA-binding transcriptional ArsR family regulator